MKIKKAILALEDGFTLEGEAFGFIGETTGEVVFNTSLTGYQEILTDPSYKYQIITMTYPHIGNVGVNNEDIESAVPQVAGFIVKENSPVASNYRSKGTLDAYLKKHKIVGIEGVDTRAITKRLRDKGAMRGVISSSGASAKSLIAKAKKARKMAGLDLVQDVTTQKAYQFNDTLLDGFEWNVYTQSAQKGFKEPKKKIYKKKYHAVCIDGGVKRNILRKLVQHGFKVTVVSAFTTAEEILKLKPDGVFLSNGPGDPEPVTYLIDTVKKLVGKVPLFGICLGHQILSLALGAKTFKLKFGHRGANQPIMDLSTRKVEIAAHNHGFATDIKSLNKRTVEMTHVNLNDETCAGIRHKKKPAFSVQYHPEGSSGPHDSDYLFKRFYDMVDKGKW
jgi:carbamoyl-phosphate synthase small subunit